MPRYFFHITDGKDHPDHEGTELPGLADAREQAIKASGEAIRDLGALFWESEGWHLRVTDEAGRELFTLDFTGRTHA